MKKSKKVLSLFLALLMVMSSMTICFTAFAEEADAKSAEAVAEAQAAIDEFFDFRTALFSPTHANYEKAVETFNAAAAKIKALSSSEKLDMDVKYYTFFLYYATEMVGRDAGKTGSDAKVYGSSNPEGLKALAALIGDFPKDYQDAIDIMSKIYTKVDGTLFNTSFDFQKKEAGYAHYEETVPTVAKLTAKGADFANYFYPYGDSFYIYMTMPTGNGKVDLYDNIFRITYNYLQDKAGKNDPKSISYTTYMQGSGSNRTWKNGENAATYKAGMEAMNAAFLTDSVPYGREAYTKTIELFAPVFGDAFKNAANLALETGMKNFNDEAVTEAEVKAVSDAVSAVTDEKTGDPLAGPALKKLMGSSYVYAASNLVYNLGSPEAYNEEVDAVTVYNSQIQFNKKNVNALVTDLQNIVNNNRLNEFVDYMKTVNENSLTDEIVKTAINKYHAMSSEYQGKVPADVKEKLVTIATKGFYDIMETVDMNKLTTEVQKQVYDKYVLMDEFKSTIPSELYDKYVLIQSPIMDMNDFADEIAEFKTAEFVRPENSEVAWTTGGIQSAVDELWDLVANTIVPLVAKNIDLSDGLDKILKDNLYQPSIIEAIFDLYATLIQNESEVEVEAMGTTMKFKLGQIISWIVTNDKIVEYLSADGDKYAGAIAKIKAVEGANVTEKVVNLAEVTFTAEDFGFKAGDREGFEDALLAVLRPITTLLAPDGKIKAMGFVNVDVNIKMFDYMSDGKYQTGVYATLIPLLEQLGMIDLPTQAEYKDNYEAVREEKGAYIAADHLIKPVIDHLFTDVVDVVSPDPLNGLIKVLPRIAHIIDTDMINNTLKDIAGSMGVLSGMLGGLDISKTAINNMLAQPIDLSSLIGSKLTITLPPIDWAKLADCCTLETVESSSDFNKYFILRNGDTDSAFSTVFYYIYKVVFADEDVYAAVRKLATDNLGSLASIVTKNTDRWAEIGDVAAYGEILDLIGTPTGDEIEKPKPEEPDDPKPPVDPENPTDPDEPSKPNKPSNPGSNNNDKANQTLDDILNNAKNQNTKDTQTKKNSIKAPSIPKTGAEKAADALIAVSALVAIGAAGSLVMLKKKNKED